MSIFTPSGWSGDGVYVQEREQTIRVLWDLELVKNYVSSNYVITNFLVGDWRGSGYYFRIDDEHYSNFDLPWMAKPKGTKYYDIDGMIYYWDNADSEHLKKVFKFELVDYDTIRVYCYKNQRTYKMYRQ